MYGRYALYGGVASVVLHTLLLFTPLVYYTKETPSERTVVLNFNILKEVALKDTSTAPPSVTENRPLKEDVKSVPERVVPNQKIQTRPEKDMPLPVVEDKEKSETAQTEPETQRESSEITNPLKESLAGSTSESQETIHQAELQEATEDAHTLRSVEDSHGESSQSAEEAGVSLPVETEFGSTEGPRFLKRVIPEYPLIARRLRIEAEVVLKLSIDEKGRLLAVEVVKPAGYGFEEAAIEALKRSTFLPAYRDGRAVPSKAIIKVRFKLK